MNFMNRGNRFGTVARFHSYNQVDRKNCSDPLKCQGNYQIYTQTQKRLELRSKRDDAIRRNPSNTRKGRITEAEESIWRRR